MAALQSSDFHVLKLKYFQKKKKKKVQCEVAVMRFLEYFTDLRVPHVLHYGLTEEGVQKI